MILLASKQDAATPTTAEPAPTTATTSSDPCGLARRGSMTREACERFRAVQLRLQLEEEYERNPNFRPYATR